MSNGPTPSTAKPPAPLARFLLAAYVLLVGYASLHPLVGWRTQGLGPLAFLEGGFPKIIIPFDVMANLAAYMPLGVLVVASMPRRWGWAITFAIATVGGALLSLGLEAAQTYLPSRVPSVLDVALNSVGTAVGAITYAFGRARLAPSADTLRGHWFRDGKSTDIGLVIVGLWLLTQLNPETLLFGTGDLRNLFEAVPAQLLPPERFVRAEALVCGANLAAVALLTGALVAPGRPAWLVVIVLVFAAFGIRAMAFGVLFSPNDMLAWRTQGAVMGVAGGLVMAFLIGWLPRGVRFAMAGLLLMAGTAIVNTAPGNPYLANSLAVWRQGHFLNFNGLTGVVSASWPFIALAWLLAGRVTRSAGPPQIR